MLKQQYLNTLAGSPPFVRVHKTQRRAVCAVVSWKGQGEGRPRSSFFRRRRALRKGGAIPAHIGSVHVKVVDVHPAEEAQEDTNNDLTNSFM